MISITKCAICCLNSNDVGSGIKYSITVFSKNCLRPTNYQIWENHYQIWKILNNFLDLEKLFMANQLSHMGKSHIWHDQGEWVGCREYWFWVTGLKRWQILIFFIVFKLHRMLISPQPCSILNGQVINVENWKLKIADMWLIPLDHVTQLSNMEKN